MKNLRRCWWLVVVLGLLTAPRLARADEPPAAHSGTLEARLELSREASAAACRADPGLRDAVAVHVGRDLFANPRAPRRLIARLFREQGAYVLRLELREDSGEVTWAPEAMRGRRCDWLVRDAGLAIAVKLDPVPAAPLPTPARVVEPPCLPPPTVPDAPPPDAVPPPAEPERAARPKVHAALEGGGLFGALPAPAFRGVVHADVRWRWFGLGLELHLTSPALTEHGPEGQARAYLWGGALVPCASLALGARWSASGCVMAVFGGRVATDLDTQATVRRAFGAGGLRAGVEVQLMGPFSLRTSVDLLTGGFSSVVRLGGASPQWKGSTVAGAVTGGLAAEVF